ncbi:hypothetical protein SERLA73DRAFT_80568 [Serpula lacrymans var. lacrymans S7.3]|uniref:Uncharacterized protein n=1 Tax=Serpula lacrymans var. lacrymans (strain S7.3) TaxID=936435 RepID=F8QJY0_SERL3|nr:hypothetical protein SERLA73DRAFT_80568 [Serpula lacrymans var. lacrymans S7.3]
MHLARQARFIGVKSRPRLLRDVHNGQFLPDLDRIINDAIKMDALLFGDIECQSQDTFQRQRRAFTVPWSSTKLAFHHSTGGS